MNVIKVSGYGSHSINQSIIPLILRLDLLSQDGADSRDQHG